MTILNTGVSYNNIISKNGMTVEWIFLDEKNIKFKVTSPEKGWVAIGLNTENELVGSNLIMAAVSDKQNLISDRYIVDFGDHQSVVSLGAESQVELISAVEGKKGTVVEFILKTKTLDEYHFNIARKQKFYLVMAYSREDDFSHHSAMRTSVEIIF
ncbi:hypothetical protein GCM10007940_19100 [Portibacter lacus]|uniref:DOMON domain-containing protein n=2 Tax=Portibacter lacus TaxID=1099794 RepID=A0AA37WFV2_9BACT|nr:hypothetical protein GCM10007940_19100 [Portibacter lacus]